MGMSGLVNTLIVTGASFAIGIYVVSQIFSNTPEPTDSTANATFHNAQTITWNAIKLGVILLIVIAAWAILSVLRK